MYKHILIATDGSEFAQKAVDHGLTLAKHLSGETTVVVVSELFARGGTDIEIGLFTPTAKLRNAFEAAARKALDAAVAQAKRIGVACEPILVTDMVPPDGILDTAEKRGSSLIVMASHGLRGIQRLLLGSVAAEVLARARIPVLIVR